MEIPWEVDDGYGGGGRPQHTEIDKHDIENCETLKDVMQLICDAIQEDYDETVSWFIKHQEDIKTKVKEILNNKEDEN